MWNDGDNWEVTVFPTAVIATIVNVLSRWKMQFMLGTPVKLCESTSRNRKYVFTF